MAKKKINGVPEEITVKLNKSQAAKIAMMFDTVLRNTGMLHNDIITDISRQIAAQMPPPQPKPVNDTKGLHKAK